MKIKFFDKQTGKAPEPDKEGDGFCIGEDGKVYEFIAQLFTASRF